MISPNTNSPAVREALSAGNLVVLRTDTIYGILAKADLPKTVDRLYAAKRRSPAKSCILLVSTIDDIPGLSPAHQATYRELSAIRPTTIITPVPGSFLPHLLRQQGTLAFRLVPPSPLAELIHTTGPLLAPSANLEGQPPATTINQAIGYFDSSVALYVDGGQVDNPVPSKIIAINDDDDIVVVRD